DFPLSDPLQSTPGGNIDAALGKIRANGDSLIFSTYFGGSSEDRSDYVVVDAAGNAYFSGWTASTNFPVTPGAFQTSFAGPQFDAFLVKLAEIPAALQASTEPSIPSTLKFGWKAGVRAKSR